MEYICANVAYNITNLDLLLSEKENLKMNETYESVLDYAELLIVKRDIDILKKFALNLDPLLQYQLLPNLSLICYEVAVWMKQKGYPLQIEQTSKYSMKKIRNKAKFFDTSTNKLINSNRNIDTIQNDYFINEMGYEPGRKYEAHTNLGIYYDAEGRIVGNTHYAFYVFQDEKMISAQSKEVESKGASAGELDSNEIKLYGYDLGTIIGSLSDSLSSISDFIVADIDPTPIEVRTQDFNTNRCLGTRYAAFKTVRLFLLHIMSSIGYTLFALKKKIFRESGLILRFEYIAYHYILLRLRQLWTYCKAEHQRIGDPNLIEVLKNIMNNSDGKLRNSAFRNCMMHFGLRDKNGKPLIDEQNCNLAVPFCGLIESQFKMTYFEYQRLIEDQLLFIYKSLAEYLSFQLL